jgi:3-oxoacyl-[acyl-carrier protein] reductase
MKAVLVTGGSRGIGRAIATRLAADGFAVAVTYRERRQAAAAVVDEIVDSGGHAVAIQADLARDGDAARCVDEAAQLLGHLDALILNAAAIPEGMPTALTLEDFDHAFAVNTRSSFLAMRRAAAILPDGGRIVALSSGVTERTIPFLVGYAASKAALEVLTRSFAHELGPRGITVNTVVPGPTRTEAMTLPAALEQSLIDQTPLGRLGVPQDVAAVVAFLLTDDAHWVTAEKLHATGGLE